jgi:hypothetical protein
MAAPKKKEKRAKCTFDYTAAQDDELSMKIGDIIVVVKDDTDGWCEGELNGMLWQDTTFFNINSLFSNTRPIFLSLFIIMRNDLIRL